MPQEFHVLQCHQCKTFQVQQVKKVLKWSCKLCGEKQSVLRVYGRGSGADCRKHVQNLNTLRGELESNQEEKIVSAKIVEEGDVHFQRFQIDSSEVEENIQNSTSSKWEKYVEPLINEDGDDVEREDDSQYTTDRVQYNTVNKQYRKHQRDSYKQYQPYPRERSNRDRNSRWKDQTQNNNDGNSVEGFSEFDQSSDCNMKGLPSACLSSKPAKRTKWDNFLGAQNLENTLECSQESKMYVPHETKIVKPNFKLLDSFLEEDCEESVSKTMNNILKVVYEHSKISNSLNADYAAFEKSNVSSSSQAHKIKIPNIVTQKKSKWETFTDTSQDDDSEFYIPDDDSLNFDNLDSDPRPGPNYNKNARDNFNFSQTQNEKDPKSFRSQTAESQVFSSVASYILESNSKLVPSISGRKVSSDPKTPCSKVPDSNAIPANPAKFSSKDEMFQVNDFDETEFEFVI